MQFVFVCDVRVEMERHSYLAALHILTRPNSNNPFDGQVANQGIK